MYFRRWNLAMRSSFVIHVDFGVPKSPFCDLQSIFIELFGDGGHQ